MIIIVPPSGGKTFLADIYPEFADGDDLFAKNFGIKASKQNLEFIISTPVLATHFKAAILKMSSQSILLTNYDPAPLGLVADIQFMYNTEEYIDHIHYCGRSDLLKQFSFTTLLLWMDGYLRRKTEGMKTYILDYDEFVGDRHTMLLNHFKLHKEKNNERKTSIQEK